jgi:glycerophosphoryl diester phosphodiesterase
VLPPAPNPFLAGKAKPIVVGHRGVPHLHQENTLAGFRRAVELGVPAVELDVRITKDRRAVCVHDSNLKRLTGLSGEVIDMKWDQLSRLRVLKNLAMGVDPSGKDIVATYEREEPIPLLAEVLSAVATKVVLNVEIKIEMPRWWRVEAAEIVAQVIADTKVEDRVIVTSFDPRLLVSTRRAHPDIAVGFCFDDTMLDFSNGLLDRLPALPVDLTKHHGHHRGHNARRLLNRLLETNFASWLLGTRVVGAEHTLVGRETVRSMHRRGIAIGTHTLFPLGSSTGKPIASSAASIEEVKRLVELGVDWIETDDPARLMPLVYGH